MSDVNNVTFIKKSVINLLSATYIFQYYFKNNIMKKAGILIAILGLALTIFTAVTFFTREKIVDIGSLKITANKPHHLSWSPLIGLAVTAFGVVIILVSPKK
jgi:divalent metal cation (Fe/Co/Zn/Cd) transporter